MKNTQELLEVLTLEDLGGNNFSGISKDVGNSIVFGGQVLAQSLNAAYKTISNNRVLHSLHSYFLEAGNLDLPIIYNVENIRDGGSFSTRRVIASQNDKAIFILSCSFHKKEEGYEHQKAIKKDIKQPEDLFSWTDMFEELGDFLPRKLKTFLSAERPVDFKPVQVPNPFDLEDLPPFVDVWFKLKEGSLDVSLALKQQVLTYVSDYNVLTACLNPNASVANFDNTQVASLDHSMWFYRDFDLSDWMLFSIESPSTSGGRGLAFGNIYTREGELVASVSQETLMRPIKK